MYTPALFAASEGGSSPVSAAAEPWLWERSGDAVLSYGALLGVLALGAVPALRGQQLADLPYFIALAVVTIYIGAHRGLGSKQRQSISLREVRSGRVKGKLAIERGACGSVSALTGAQVWAVLPSEPHTDLHALGTSTQRPHLSVIVEVQAVTFGDEVTPTDSTTPWAAGVNGVHNCDCSREVPYI